MSSIRLFSGAISGLEAFPVEVEVDSTPGLHFFNIVGLPDKTVDESKDRIASAIRNSDFVAPNQKNRRVIVNLAPADIKKEGSSYDLPIALGYLLTTSQIAFNTEGKLFFGELSLDVSLRRINGVLPLAIMARQSGFRELFLPTENAAEAALVSNISIIGAKNIQEVVAHLTGKQPISPTKPQSYQELLDDPVTKIIPHIDINQVRGVIQELLVAL